MNDTPRTEAFIKECTSGKFHKYVGPADISNLLVFCRTIERELTAEKQRSERLEKVLRFVRKSVSYEEADAIDAALGDSNDK